MKPDLYSPRPGQREGLRAAQGGAAGARRAGGCDLFHSMHDNVHGFEITYEIDLATGHDRARRARHAAAALRGHLLGAAAADRGAASARRADAGLRKRIQTTLGGEGGCAPALRPDRRSPQAPRRARALTTETAGAAPVSPCDHAGVVEPITFGHALRLRRPPGDTRRVAAYTTGRDAAPANRKAPRRAAAGRSSTSTRSRRSPGGRGAARGRGRRGHRHRRPLSRRHHRSHHVRHRRPRLVRAARQRQRHRGARRPPALVPRHAAAAGGRAPTTARSRDALRASSPRRARSSRWRWSAATRRSRTGSIAPIVAGTMLGEVAKDRLVTTGGAQVG